VLIGAGGHALCVGGSEGRAGSCALCARGRDGRATRAVGAGSDAVCAVSAGG